MELNSLMQALAKDLAEQMRPMVADMVRQELAATSNTWQDGDQVLQTIAEKIDLQKLAGHIDVSTLAGELTEGQLNDIAGDIDLADLARELDAEKITENIDLEEAFKEFFQDNSFSIRP
jgi:hypothetical protein